VDDRAIVRLSLLCSIVGLAAVYGAALSARPRLTPIAAIDNDFIGARVVVSGQVVDLRSSDDGHLFLKLRDGSGGVVSVPIFSRIRSALREPIELLDFVQVRGEVKLYREEFEVVPAEAGDVQVVHTAPVSVSEISQDNVGNPVKVQGVVVERDIVGSGHLLLTLGEGDARLVVFVPGWIAGNGFPSVDLGDRIKVSGWLQLYKGALELRVTSPGCVQVLEGG
jgi:DNA/RNA endonuclease YhcR with UshA esterase domain